MEYNRNPVLRPDFSCYPKLTKLKAQLADLLDYIPLKRQR